MADNLPPIYTKSTQPPLVIPDGFRVDAARRFSKEPPHALEAVALFIAERPNLIIEGIVGAIHIFDAGDPYSVVYVDWRPVEMTVAQGRACRAGEHVRWQAYEIRVEGVDPSRALARRVR